MSTNGFISFLKKAGQDILKVITFGAEGASIVAPAISMYNPALGALLSGSATAVLTAEAAGATAVANAPSADNGAQKAALAITAITPLANQFAKSVGVSNPTEAQVQKFNDALVAALNAFGVVKEGVPLASTSTPAAS